MPNIFKRYIKKYGYGPFLMLVIFVFLLVVFAMYGERLNPFDGKMWSDFAPVKAR